MLGPTHPEETHFPRRKTATRTAPIRYAIRSAERTSNTTKSALRPAAIVPARSAAPTAWAAFTVAAVSASAGVSRAEYTAWDITIVIDSTGEFGETSEPRATGTPASTISR